jgi:hypothetical protein
MEISSTFALSGVLDVSVIGLPDGDSSLPEVPLCCLCLLIAISDMFDWIAFDRQILGNG